MRTVDRTGKEERLLKEERKLHDTIHAQYKMDEYVDHDCTPPKRKFSKKAYYKRQNKVLLTHGGNSLVSTRVPVISKASSYS